MTCPAAISIMVRAETTIIIVKLFDMYRYYYSTGVSSLGVGQHKSERAKPCLQGNRRVISFQHTLVLNVSANYLQIIQLIVN